MHENSRSAPTISAIRSWIRPLPSETNDSTFPVAASGSSAARWNGDLTAISAKSNSPSSSSAEPTASSGDGGLGPVLLDRQAGVAQPRHVLLVRVQHDDALDGARELRGGDAADRAAADDQDAGVGHATGCAGSAATSVRRKRPVLGFGARSSAGSCATRVARNAPNARMAASVTRPPSVEPVASFMSPTR